MNLTYVSSNYENLQREHQTLNEELDKYRYDLGQVEKSDILHKEQVSSKQEKRRID
jgi:hypothetical protein